MVNVGEGSRQTSFVTSGDGLAPGVGLQAFTINALRLLKFSSGLASAGMEWNDGNSKGQALASIEAKLTNMEQIGRAHV